MDHPSDVDELPSKEVESASITDQINNTTAPTARVLALSNDFIPSNPIGPAPSESPRKSHQIHFRHPSAPSPSTSTSSSPVVNRDQAITSPFQLTSPRQAMYMTPPSPMTVYPNDGQSQGQMPMALGDFIEEEEDEVTK